MSDNMPSRDIRTLGYVLRRTNYGEADRILNLITPEGKISAIAKGVRKEKSRLAGGIEMFTLTDYNIHRGKSELAVVTGAKMVRHYNNIVRDFTKMELAGVILKKVSVAAESSDNPEYFTIVRQGLEGLDRGMGHGLVEGWFWMNLLRAMGEEVNLYRDVTGEKLDAEVSYDWEVGENCFCARDGGRYGAEEIKMLRLMTASELGVVARVKNANEIVERVLPLVKTLARA